MTDPIVEVATNGTLKAVAVEDGSPIVELKTAGTLEGVASATSDPTVMVKPATGTLEASVFIPLLLNVDFTSLTTGDMSAAAFLSATGLTFTRASDGFTVQTSAATMVSGLSGSNRPRIGQGINSSSARGLVLEENRTNVWPSSNNFSTSLNGGAGVTYTANAATGPDGNVNAGHNVVVINGFSNYYFNGSISSALASVWVKSGNGGAASFQAACGDGSGATTHAVGGTSGTSWQRITVPFITASSIAFIVADGRDWSGSGGIVNGARDELNAYAQIEQVGGGNGGGVYSTEAITTTGGGNVTRATEQLSIATGSTIVSSGRIGFEAKIIPKGSSTQYGTDPRRLWALDANNYVAYNPTSHKIDIVIGGTTFTPTTTLSWSAGDTVEFWVAAGGGTLNSVANYRVNGGATVNLGTSGSAAASISPGGSAITFGCAQTGGSGTAVLAAWWQHINCYASGQKPSWATAA